MLALSYSLTKCVLQLVYIRLVVNTEDTEKDSVM